jgi:hypothetical protein
MKGGSTSDREQVHGKGGQEHRALDQSLRGGRTPGISTSSIPGNATLLLIGEAVLPMSATATTNGFAVQVHSNAPVRIDLHTSTNDALSRMLAEFAKVRVAAPALHVALGGTFQQPQGTIQISADSLAPASMTNDTLPELKNARAEIVFDLEAVQLREFRGNIAGQPITASGEVPIAAHGEWRSRLQLDKARAELRMPSADLAAFAPFATNLLAPRGTMEVNATLNPGMQVGGFIRVTDASDLCSRCPHSISSMRRSTPRTARAMASPRTCSRTISRPRCTRTSDAGPTSA